MSHSLEFYKPLAQLARSPLTWLAHMQADALDYIAVQGFPSRYDEEWKYTVLDSLLKESFTPFTLREPDTFHATSDIPLEHQLAIHNGTLAPLPDWVNSLPAGVIILPLAHALTAYESLVKPHLNKILQQKHAFHALNTALMQPGFFIYVPQGVCLTEPLVITHYQDQKNGASHLRHLIIAGRK